MFVEDSSPSSTKSNQKRYYTSLYTVLKCLLRQVGHNYLVKLNLAGKYIIAMSEKSSEIVDHIVIRKRIRRHANKAFVYLCYWWMMLRVDEI